MATSGSVESRGLSHVGVRLAFDLLLSISEETTSVSFGKHDADSAFAKVSAIETSGKCMDMEANKLQYEMLELTSLAREMSV